MSSGSHTELPDSDTARQMISEAVPELGASIASRARVHAKAVRSVLGQRVLWGSRKEEALNLAKSIGYGNSSWADSMASILKGFFALDDPYRNELDRSLQLSARSPDSGVRTILNELHEHLVALADNLSVRPPALLPSVHPPKFARLHEHVVAETVAKRIAMVIDEGLNQYYPARPWPGYQERCERCLDPFMTTEVSEGFARATRGFDHAERLCAIGLPGYIEEIHHRIHCAYVVIAVNYLDEVLKLMPDYAEASGQGKPRYPITVYGNVGAINSEVNNSNVSVADAVNSIGTTIEAIADRGQTSAAAAIRALSEAVQQAPELAEDQRAQLLDNVADIADAAAEPAEPRQRSRAKAAMTAITTAANASSQLAQAVSNWHDVFGKLM